MIRIAIIDDQATDRSLLSDHLYTYMNTHRIACKVQEFDSAEAFLDKLATGRFDLAFFDIYMGGASGMAAAQKLYALDKNCRIIFLTTSTEHAQISYSVHAVYYLVKPLDQTQFEQAMDFCCLKPDYATPFLPVNIDGTNRLIDTEQILYIDYQSRMVRIHFADHFLMVNKSFGDVTSALEADDRFLTIFRGVMVNMQHITGYNDIFFKLDNGQKLQITIRNKRAITQAYRDYIFKHMGG